MKKYSIVIALTCAFLLGCGVSSTVTSNAKASQESRFVVVSQEDIGGIQFYVVQDKITRVQYIMKTDSYGKLTFEPLRDAFATNGLYYAR